MLLGEFFVGFCIVVVLLFFMSSGIAINGVEEESSERYELPRSTFIEKDIDVLIYHQSDQGLVASAGSLSVNRFTDDMWVVRG